MQGRAERSRNQPSQHLHRLLPASRAARCTPLSFWLPVACGEAGLVIDTHPLVKSLKMCPFPNRASETARFRLQAGSSCIFRASKTPRQAPCSFPGGPRYSGS